MAVDDADEEEIESLAQQELPPESCHHYQSHHEVPKAIKKYWLQRHDIFSLYDEGVWLTDSAWYGVTPEVIANKIAAHIAQSAPASKTILIDAFAGVGGNTIAFARSGRWNQIFAVESDPDTLACAKHNAAIYGVENRIWWIEGDCFDVLETRLKGVGKDAIVFGSPPWGGPEYNADEVFRLATMQPYHLADLYQSFSKISSDVVLYLPRTSDLNEIAEAAASQEEKVPVVHYCMRGASKALCAYFGNFNLD